MILSRFKCTVCSREFYTSLDDVEELDKKKDDPICPFCDPRPGKPISRSMQVGDIKFDDRSTLDGNELDSVVEFLKEVLSEVSGNFETAYHRIERLRRKNIDGDTDESK